MSEAEGNSVRIDLLSGRGVVVIGEARGRLYVTASVMLPAEQVMHTNQDVIDVHTAMELHSLLGAFIKEATCSS